ncbi:MAG: flagellar basal body-associated FliL family protein [Gammaproteobacteria bacterium]|nr:flagellar basal body-associated FliL family protein [Gammaproteobacteria bacterium]
MAEEETNAPEEGEKKKKGGNLIVIILIVLIVLILGGVGALFMTGIVKMGGDDTPQEEAHTDEESHAAIYFKLEPAFVSNITLKKRSRFIQIAIEVVSTDPEAIENLKIHSPVIRNNLGILFSGIGDEEVNTREGKERLRSQVLKEIQGILKDKSGMEGIDDVFFTGFVVQ